MRTLLVPVDFSPACEAALAHAVELAARDADRVVALHVVSLPLYPFADGMIIPSPAQVTDLLTLAGRQLEALCARHRRAGIALEAHVVEGAPDEAILRYADEHRCDLIVMGTHGRTGFRHLVLGSVTERVLRAATVPVLTLRSGGATSPAIA